MKAKVDIATIARGLTIGFNGSVLDSLRPLALRWGVSLLKLALNCPLVLLLGHLVDQLGTM